MVCTFHDRETNDSGYQHCAMMSEYVADEPVSNLHTAHLDFDICTER